MKTETTTGLSDQEAGRPARECCLFWGEMNGMEMENQSTRFLNSELSRGATRSGSLLSISMVSVVDAAVIQPAPLFLHFYNHS
jgi:hypothetical protein